MNDKDKAFWVRSEEGEPFKKCGDCIHMDVCELNPFLPEFNRDNVAFCDAFKNREEYVEVVRCKDCIHWYVPDGACLKIYSDGDVSPCAWQFRNTDDFCSYGERKDNGN